MQLTYQHYVIIKNYLQKQYYFYDNAFQFFRCMLIYKKNTVRPLSLCQLPVPPPLPQPVLNIQFDSSLGYLRNTSARPEVRGTADVGWRNLFPLPLNPPRTHSRLYHHMCLRTDGQ